MSLLTIYSSDMNGIETETDNRSKSLSLVYLNYFPNLF